MAKPDFSHLDFSDKTCVKWREHMQAAAEKLEKVLWPNMQSWGTCLVCNSEYPANIASHIWGRAHCSKLKERLNWQEPGSPAELERYTQVWPTPKGDAEGYSFNHVTGHQQHCKLPSSTDAPPGPVAAVAIVQAESAAKPSEGAEDVMFKHDLGYAAACETKQAWRDFMESPSKFLEDFLGKATGKWDHLCCICNKSMTQGARDHLTSMSHWKTLWQKLQDMNQTAYPPAEIAADMTSRRPWVQRFSTPAGEYYFNHLTGGQRLTKGSLEDASSEAQAAGAPGPAASVPSVAPTSVQCALPPTNLEEALQHGTLLCPHDTGYGAALETKESWRNFMEASSSCLDDHLGKATGQWDHPCGVCSKPMTRGARDHLTSQGHWSTLWYSLQSASQTRLPPENVASDMSPQRPWVQVFEIPTGQLTFNHLTGALAMQQPSPPSCHVGSADAAGASSSSSSFNPSAPVFVPCSQRQDGDLPVRDGIGYNEALSNVCSFTKYMDEPNRRLAEVIRREMPNCDSKCIVCSSVISSHDSRTHFENIWVKLKSTPTPSDVQLWNKAWVQNFETPRGTYLFNHLTGQQAWKADLSSPADMPSSERGQKQASEPMLGSPVQHVWPEEGQEPASAPLAVSQSTQALKTKPVTPMMGRALALLADGRKLNARRGGRASATVPDSACQKPEQTMSAPPLLQPVPAPSGATPKQDPAVAKPQLLAQLPTPAVNSTAEPEPELQVMQAAPAQATGSGMEAEHFHWRCLVAGPSQDLIRALGPDGLAADVWDLNAQLKTCDVCSSAVPDLEEHLSSLEHYKQLRQRCAEYSKSLKEVSVEALGLQGTPWIQDFGRAMFNHLTLEVVTKKPGKQVRFQ
eukprot:TRINITY_DN6861_c2_g1_i2.p1 TRINITY_DN6861_c2_g1~~TRINITY_DN6861_c2_g1_i2.p1  ORF type:complete len:866 (-),score=168.73 TRINITY_DN6861_c2_g1_i2:2-2578(-)